MRQPYCKPTPSAVFFNLNHPGPEPKPEVEPDPATPEITPPIPPDSPVPNIV